jgi:N-acetyl-anhydromuramyl-L-alanine amidase AmpD
MDTTRALLIKEYVHRHYGINVDNPRVIIPKIIVIHWTGMDDFQSSFKSFLPAELSKNRKELIVAGELNVGAHFLVDFNGTIYQILPVTYFARHVIGLNLVAIGIENVGGNKKPLTDAQLLANELLVRCLVENYPEIKYVIGHYEYELFEGTPLFMEKDVYYRTKKLDPGKEFMARLRKRLEDLYKNGILIEIKNRKEENEDNL